MEQDSSRVNAIVSQRLGESFLLWRTGRNKSVVPPNLASTQCWEIRVSREGLKF